MPSDKEIAAASVNRHAFWVLAGFALIMLILASITTLGLKTLASSTGRFGEAVEVNHAKIELMTTMLDLIRERMIKVYTIIHLDDPFLIEEEWELYSAYASRFLETREKLLTFKLSLAQRQQLDAQQKTLQEAKRTLDKTVNLVREGNIEEALHLISEASKTNSSVLDEVGVMREYQASLAAAALKQARLDYQQTRGNIIYLSIFGAAVCLLIILFIVRRIKIQAAMLAATLDKLADANTNLERNVEQRTAQLMAARSENMRMSAELQLSQRLQYMLLPKDAELDAIEDLDIAGFMQAADEVGGDYYDVLRTSGGTLFSIGDVTGHGLESGVLMLMIQSAVRTLLAAGIKDPRDFLQALNCTVHDNAKRLNTDKNMTLSLLAVDGNTVRIAGQHEDILVVRKDGAIEMLDTADLGFPLGIVPEIDEFVAQTQITLEPGDGFVIFTDGITEAFNKNKEMYGQQRLCDLLSKNWRNYSAAQLKQLIVHDVRSFMSRQYDDVTFVVVKRKEALVSMAA